MTVADEPAASTGSARPEDTARRPRLRSVAMPSEHGGWGLTIEPVVLGLLLAPSWAGLMIGIATMLAFLSRTPLKMALVDHHRGRWLERSRLALVVATAELSALAILVVLATILAGWSWWIPVLVAAPMIVVELWYDARSRSRRLVPELFGSIGVAASAASIAVAGGAAWELAAGAWAVLAARALGSIPFVRAQIAFLRRGVAGATSIIVAQAASVAVGAVSVMLDTRLAIGFIAVVALAAYQLVAGRRAPTSAKVLGLTQMALGLALVVVTGLGVSAS